MIRIIMRIVRISRGYLDSAQVVNSFLRVASTTLGGLDSDDLCLSLKIFPFRNVLFLSITP